jgi:hypothetical protein
MPSQGLEEPKHEPLSTLDEGGEVGADLSGDDYARCCLGPYSTWYALRYTSVLTKNFRILFL